MANTLALCLDAPMQSWGLRSRFNRRDTAQEPTKSGVVGLLAAALGIGRDDDEKIRSLAGLRMGVRVDREGLVERDYHTASNVPTTEGTGHRTVVSQRYYLADALFLTAVESDNHDLLTQLHAALLRPQWPIFFGRKAFVPARPLVSASPTQDQLGIHPGHVNDVLHQHPWLENRSELRSDARTTLARGQEHLLRTLVDTHATDARAEPRHDVPGSFRNDDRRFSTRAARTGHVALTETLIAGEHPCT